MTRKSRRRPVQGPRGGASKKGSFESAIRDWPSTVRTVLLVVVAGGVVGVLLWLLANTLNSVTIQIPSSPGAGAVEGSATAAAVVTFVAHNQRPRR